MFCSDIEKGLMIRKEALDLSSEGVFPRRLSLCAAHVDSLIYLTDLLILSGTWIAQPAHSLKWPRPHESEWVARVHFPCLGAPSHCRQAADCRISDSGKLNFMYLTLVSEHRQTFIFTIFSSSTLQLVSHHSRLGFHPVQSDCCHRRVRLPSKVNPRPLKDHLFHWASIYATWPPTSLS